MTNKIVVFDVAEIQGFNDTDEYGDPIRGGDRSTRTRGPATMAGVRAVEIDFSHFKANMLSFIENVRTMLGEVSEAAGNFTVEQVEVQAEISGEGKVGFMGSGVKASGGASIKIVFERRKEKASPTDPS